MRLFRVFWMAAIVLGVNGCMSLLCRSGGKEFTGGEEAVFYPGIQGLRAALSELSENHTPVAPSAVVLFMSLAFLDSPLSFALDTVLLPVDLVIWPFRQFGEP